jgi:hypothetical protein
MTLQMSRMAVEDAVEDREPVARGGCSYGLAGSLGWQCGRAPGLEATVEVARAKPSRCSVAAARLDWYPSLHIRITRSWNCGARGWRCALAGSSRHSRTFRGMTSASGTIPSWAICDSERLSINVAPAPIASSAASGSSRSSRRRASSSSWSIVFRLISSLGATAGRPGAVSIPSPSKHPCA